MAGTTATSITPSLTGLLWTTGPAGPRKDGDRDPLPGSRGRGRAGRQAAAGRPAHVRQQHRPGERQPGGRRPGPEGGQAGPGPDRSGQTAACMYQQTPVPLHFLALIPSQR